MTKEEIEEGNRLSAGTRIKFLKDLDRGPDEDGPACTYARKGDGGEVTGHGCLEGHWVKWDKWPHPFGAKLGNDFIEDNNNQTTHK